MCTRTDRGYPLLQANSLSCLDRDDSRRGCLVLLKSSPSIVSCDWLDAGRQEMSLCHMHRRNHRDHLHREHSAAVAVAVAGHYIVSC